MNKKHLLVVVCIFILVIQACSSPSATPVSEPTKTAAAATSTSTPTPTVTPTSTSTPIPLAWTQIYDGQDFERDMVSTFATDKKDPNVIYAAMKNSGVYKTVDGGLSWLAAHDGLVNMQVESLLIDSQNPLILYAGTMGGIFKTEDGGGNWSRIGEGIYLLMDIQDNSHLYARDENGIYETTDQGNIWNRVYSLKKDCPDAISSWAIHPSDGDMLFIGGGETCTGVYQSSNSGHSWTLIGMEDKPNINALAIGLDEQGNYSVYLFPLTFVAEWRIYILHNGDSNWSFAQVMRCDILSSDPDNLSTIYCASQTSLHATRGKGEPWQAIPGTQSILYSAIHIDHPNGTDRIIVGGRTLARDQIRESPGVGIFISVDGGKSWVERNNGIGSARAELKIDPMDNTKVYLATYYAETEEETGCSLYRSHDSGNNWASIKSEWQSPSWCGPAFDAAHVLYMMERGKLQTSWDGGESWLWKRGQKYIGGRWIDTTLIYALPPYYGEVAQSISVNPYTKGSVYAVGNTIYYSTGTGFWQLSEGSEGSWDGRLFYTNQSKMIFSIGRYHQKYSTDNGVTWLTCGEDITTAQSDSRLALDLQGNKLYLATPGQGVLVSTDKCQSWLASNNGLDNLFVNTVAIDPNNPDILYAGTDGGAYVTYDGGMTWGQINDGLVGSNIVYSIAVDYESNVYAATPYGVFKLEQK